MADLLALQPARLEVPGARAAVTSGNKRVSDKVVSRRGTREWSCKIRSRCGDERTQLAPFLN